MTFTCALCIDLIESRCRVFVGILVSATSICRHPEVLIGTLVSRSHKCALTIHFHCNRGQVATRAIRQLMNPLWSPDI
jgi:hypothetical protein